MKKMIPVWKVLSLSQREILRELLATGAVFGNVILHNALLPLAALPAGGFVIVGILAAIWCAAANLYTDYKHEEVRRLYADRKH